MTNETIAVTAAKLADLRQQLYDSDETRIRYRVENDFLRKQLAEAQEREAQMAAVLRPFADIGIGTNPDYEPMIRLPREAILRARAALASAPASPSPVLRDAVIEECAALFVSDDDVWWKQEAARRIHALASRPELCKHEWTDMRNSIVVSGEICLKCGAIRAGNAASRPVSERDGEKA